MLSISRTWTALRILFLVFPRAIAATIRAYIPARARGLDLITIARFSWIRSIMWVLSEEEAQSLLPSSETVFEQRSKMGVSSDEFSVPETSIEIVENGACKLFWIGKKSPGSNVILFLHGGGYVLPLFKGHVDWMDHLRRTTMAAGLETSVALLEYGLCPKFKYPHQMREACKALEYLLSIGYSPSKIIIGGDSVGGHLALGVLSHLLHPYPGGIIPQIRLSAPLGGCFLVSPLISLNLTTPSYSENRYTDMLAREVVQKWGVAFVQNSPFEQEEKHGKGWGMALSAAEAWWDGLGSVVRRVYLVGGEKEVFRDHIVELGRRFQQNRDIDFSFYLNGDESHDGTLFDFDMGKMPSEYTLRLAEWVVQSLVFS